MKISVIIPAYNEELILPQCLASLKKQTKKPHEIIVVDNNSTDKTAEIAKQYDVTIISEKRQGISYSRNAGFNAATGDIIARTDADTTVPPTWIEQIEHDFSSEHYDAITGTFRPLDFPINIMRVTNLFLHFQKMRLGHYQLCGPNLAITRKMWNQVKDEVCMNNALYHEDLDLSIHIAMHGGVIGYDETLIVNASFRRFMRNPIRFLISDEQKTYNTMKRHPKKDYLSLKTKKII